MTRPIRAEGTMRSGEPKVMEDPTPSPAGAMGKRIDPEGTMRSGGSKVTEDPTSSLAGAMGRRRIGRRIRGPRVRRTHNIGARKLSSTVDQDRGSKIALKPDPKVGVRLDTAVSKLSNKVDQGRS